MASFTACIASPAASPLSAVRAYWNPTLPPFQTILRLNFAPRRNPNITLPTLRISHKFAAASKWVSSVSNLGDSNSYVQAKEEATIDLKLPRRRMSVKFTCNECGGRTERLINRLAYERGTVFVQCAGCLRHHKLVDNLDLVVEYDLREDTSVDTNSDQF